MKQWSIIEWLVCSTDIWTACSSMSDNYSIIRSLCENCQYYPTLISRLHCFLNQTMIISKMTLNWSYQFHGNKTQRALFLWMIWGGWTSFLTDKAITNNICKWTAFFHLQNYEYFKPTLFLLSVSIYASLRMYCNSAANRSSCVHLVGLSMDVPDFLASIWHILWYPQTHNTIAICHNLPFLFANIPHLLTVICTRARNTFGLQSILYYLSCFEIFITFSINL